VHKLDIQRFLASGFPATRDKTDQQEAPEGSPCDVGMKALHYFYVQGQAKDTQDTYFQLRASTSCL
jgi:hypothetical protein